MNTCPTVKSDLQASGRLGQDFLPALLRQMPAGVKFLDAGNVPGVEDVLRAAVPAKDDPDLDLIWCGFDRDLDVLHLLDDCGYLIFDTEYCTTQDEDWIRDSLRVTRQTPTTTWGVPKSPIHGPPRDLEGYAIWFKMTGQIQTRLLAVRRTFESVFRDALARLPA